MFCGQDVGNFSSYAPSRGTSEHTTISLNVKGVARNCSPPWRDDDKDGHYMFALGENLTSRCNYTLLSLRNLYSYIMVKFSLFSIGIHFGHVDLNYCFN